MNEIEIKKFRLIGLALPGKTTNQNGQSEIDCGSLWQKFEREEFFSKIPGRSTNEIFAVYHQYEGDHLAPFSYFIGCKVEAGAEVPEGMSSLTIPDGTYSRIAAKGKMPDCIATAWKGIWESSAPRIYTYDFEVYGEKSKDWNNAEVDIFLSIK